MSSTTVNFNLKTAGFANYANQTLTFKLLQVSADKADDTVILPGIVTATSAANGTGSAALFTTGESDIESTFEVIFPNREKGLFQIPATSAGGSINLSDLLVDHVPGGSAAPQNSIYDAAVAYSIQRPNHTGNLSLEPLPNGSITGKLAIANGGTNASTVSAARASLGAQEQKDVLDDLGALSAPGSDGQFIVATGAGAFQYEVPATARTSLGLGTIATQASDSVNIDGGAIDGAVIGANNAAAVTGTTITASTKFAGAIDGTVGATTPAAGTFTSLTSTSINVSDGNITNAGDINCDSISADDAATGLNVIFDGTDTGDNKITLTDNLANALDITESTNSYLKFTTTDSGEKVVFGKDLDISGDHDLIIGTGTGTKIGTAATQKIGFFNATPVVQQNGTNEGTGFTAGSGTTTRDDSTFTGNVGSTAYRINDIVKALKNLGILAQ
jgi:hypothetical protein